MKVIIVLFSVFLFVGCFEHWREPSGKLASQADNYLTNDRSQFFYEYCSIAGAHLNCLEDKGIAHNDCLDISDRSKVWIQANGEKSKRFFSHENTDFALAKQQSNEMQELINNRDLSGMEEFLKENLQTAIEHVTEKEWEQCAEVAEASK